MITNSKGKIVAILILIIAIWVAFSATRCSVKNRIDTEVNEMFSWFNSEEKVTVENNNPTKLRIGAEAASIIILPTDKDVVTATMATSLGAETVVLHEGEDTTFDIPKKAKNRKIVVEVPERIKDLIAVTYSGKIEVSSFTGNSIALTNSSSNIDVSRVNVITGYAKAISGHVEILDSNFENLEGSSISSTVELYNVNSQIANLNTKSGGIKIQDGEFTNLTATSTSSSVKIGNIKAETANLSSISGSVKVESSYIDIVNASSTSSSVVLNLLKNQRIEARSTSGSINITVPNANDYGMHLKTNSGSIKVLGERKENSYNTESMVNPEDPKYINASSISASITIE